MWNYEKRLQFPVKISKCDPRSAKIIMSQFGGLDCSNIHTTNTTDTYRILTYHSFDHIQSSHIWIL